MTAKLNKNTKFLLKQEFAKSNTIVIAPILVDMGFGEILPQSNGSKKG